MNVDRLNSARQFLDRATLALDGGQLDLARQQLAFALKLDPSLAEARLIQARLDLHTARPLDALSALDAHDQYHPDHRDDPKVAFLRARALCRSGQDTEALDLLPKLARQYPDDERPHRLLAALRLKLEQVDGAIESLTQILRLKPSDRSVRRTLADLMCPTRPDDAAALLLADPSDIADPALLLRVARIHWSHGRLRDAEETYRNLLSVNSDDAVVWLESGKLADAIGASDLAAARLEKAIELHLSYGRDPNEPMAALARVHMHTGRLERSARCWLRLARRQPGNEEAWEGALVCAIALGRTSLARRAKQRLQDTLGSPRTPGPATKAPAETSLAMAKRGKGIERRTRLAALWQHATVGIQIGRFADGDYDDRAARRSPLGRLLKRAATSLEQHTIHYPDRADTHYHQAVCQDSLGNQARSVEATENALRINPRYQNALKLAERQITLCRVA